MDPVSCVSCVSWVHCVNLAETHETFHRKSGMRYQHSSWPISEHEFGPSFPLYPHSYPQTSGERAQGSWAGTPLAYLSFC